MIFMKEKKFISIENTRPIFVPNFSGDPERDRFGSNARQVNLVIPDPEQALDLRDAGFNVKETKPREDDGDDFEPVYYVNVKLNYNSDYPPRVYLVSGDADPVLLDEESVDMLDRCYILNINAVLNPYYNQRTDRKSLYVRTMYVEQDIEEDPFASRYIRSRD